MPYTHIHIYIISSSNELIKNVNREIFRKTRKLAKNTKKIVETSINVDFFFFFLYFKFQDKDKKREKFTDHKQIVLFASDGISCSNNNNDNLLWVYLMARIHKNVHIIRYFMKSAQHMRSYFMKYNNNNTICYYYCDFRTFLKGKSVNFQLRWYFVLKIIEIVYVLNNNAIHDNLVLSSSVFSVHCSFSQCDSAHWLTCK